jgi:hypothetical protein
MKTPVHAQLPQELVDEARAFIKDGGAPDLDTLIAESLRRYLESHSAAMTEAFVRDDVKWGLHGRD